MVTSMSKDRDETEAAQAEKRYCRDCLRHEGEVHSPFCPCGGTVTELDFPRPTHTGTQSGHQLPDEMAHGA